MKLFLVLFIIILSVKNSLAKECHLSDSVELCYLKYKIKYDKVCYENKVVITELNYKEKRNTNITDIKYKIKNNKLIGGKNWFHFCFYPVNYYKGICRKNICGDFNVPKKGVNN